MLLSKILISLALIIPLTDFEGVTAATKEIECREENLYRQLYSNNPRLKQEKDITDRKFTPRSILKALLSCNIYVGDLRVSHRGYKYDDENENVREEHLEYLRNLTKITGHVELDLKYYQRFQSLSFLANVKEFFSSLPHGFVLLSSNISALNFSNIKFNVGCYDIRDNKNLCYMENFKTINPKLKSCYSHDSPLQIDKSIDVCRKEGKICDSCYCDAQAGCWGPGARRCFKCKDWKAGEVCVTSCSEVKGYYNSKEITTKECKRCHGSCEYCKGPKEEDCLKVDEQGSAGIYLVTIVILIVGFIIIIVLQCRYFEEYKDLCEKCNNWFKNRSLSGEETGGVEDTQEPRNTDRSLSAGNGDGDDRTASSENGTGIDSQIMSYKRQKSKQSSHSESDDDGTREESRMLMSDCQFEETSFSPGFNMDGRDNHNRANNNNTITEHVLRA